MTNNVRNRLKIVGKKEQVRNVLEYIKGDEEVIDFNKIIRMPSDLDVESSSSGEPTWFEWMINNWGTKWNAYDTELKNDNEIWFNTAWENVNDKIIYKLSLIFPEVVFEYSFSDEDIANNCGKSTFKNGMGVLNWLENGSKQAFDFYIELHPEYEELYEWVDGDIKYKG